MKKLIIIAVLAPLAILWSLFMFGLALNAVGWEAPEEPVKTTVTKTEDPETGAKESSRREVEEEEEVDNSDYCAERHLQFNSASKGSAMKSALLLDAKQHGCDTAFWGS